MDKHSKKSSSLLHYPVLVVFSLFFLGLFALDLITPDRAYSEMENTTLSQRPALTRALKKHHVPCKEVLFPNATHGVGTGAGTDADGWMLDAANFWETQING